MIECIDNALSPMDLQEWEDFFNEFTNSTTYALVHSIDVSLIVDDDNDRLMSKSSDTMPPKTTALTTPFASYDMQSGS